MNLSGFLYNGNSMGEEQSELPVSFSLFFPRTDSEARNLPPPLKDFFNGEFFPGSVNMISEKEK